MGKTTGITLFFVCAFTVFQASAQNEILGFWMNEDKDAIIEIYENNRIFNGRIVWLKDSLDSFGQPVRDVFNDRSSLRSRKVMGTDMLMGFIYTDEAWRKGEIYNYKSGNDYNGKITLDDDGNLRLKGYYSILFFLGRTKTWTRPARPIDYGLR